MRFRPRLLFILTFIIFTLLFNIFSHPSIRKPHFVFWGFQDFEYAQFNMASKIANVRISQAESLDSILENASGDTILFINSMGSMYKREQVPIIDKIKAKGTRIINVYPHAEDSCTNINRNIYRNIASYYYYGGLENYTNLFKYTKNNLCGIKTITQPPKPMPKEGLFVKDKEEYFLNYKDYSHYLNTKSKEDGMKPKIAFITTNIGPQNIFNKIMLDYFINKLEENNFLTFPIISTSSQTREDLLRQIKPDIIICSPHGRIFEQSSIDRLFNIVNSPLLLAVNLFTPYYSWVKEDRNMVAGLMAASMVLPEMDGAIEPIATSALMPFDGKTNISVLTPIEERTDKLIKRAHRWAVLQKKENKDKKVVIFYYADFGRSEMNISGLDFAPSLFNLLYELKENGFDTGNLPKDKDEFSAIMQNKGIIYGPWAKGAYNKFLKEEDAYIKVDKDDYMNWVKKNFSKSLQEQILSGLAQSKSKTKYFAVPALQFGNIAILPQSTSWGAESAGEVIVSHNISSGDLQDDYCAKYLWAKEGFGADAIIHFGTHGTLEFISGKEVFLSEDDLTDALISDLPNGYIYIVDDVAEALIAKRRSLAVILSHLSPPLLESGLYSDLKNLADDMHSYLISDNAAIKEGLLKSVTQGLIKCGLDKMLNLKSLDERLIIDQELIDIHDRFHHMSKELIPIGLHTYGQLPEDDILIEMVYLMLGEDFKNNLLSLIIKEEKDIKLDCQLDARLKSLGIEILIRLLKNNESPNSILAKYGKENSGKLSNDLEKARDFMQRLKGSKDEIASCINLLEGKYIFPSSGGDPIFNPDSLPTGRNLYGVNPEAIPTKAALLAGEKLTNSLLDKYFKEEGRIPKKIAFTLWGVNTVMDQGITEAQILWLIGVRPLYDSRNYARDVELIPQEELKRPRIDVVIQISGEYRDIFGSRIELIDKAIRLAAEDKSNRYENFIQQNSQLIEKELKLKGFSEVEAKELSFGRIFGPSAGNYGIGTRDLYKNTSSWDNEEQIARAHIASFSGLYSSKTWGKSFKNVFETIIKDTDIILQTRSMKRVGGPLSLDHTYEYAGGLSIAVRSINGKEPKNYFADNRDLNNPEIITLKDAVINEAITRLWNPKFIQGLMENNSSGAVELKDQIGNLLGWQIAKPDDITDDIWQKTFEIYFNDEYKIGLDIFFNEKNPYAYQDIAGIMLETIRKGYWSAESATIDKLMQVYVTSVAESGPSCSIRTCANQKLAGFVSNYFSKIDVQAKTTFKRYKMNLEATTGEKTAKSVGAEKKKEIDLEKITIIR